MSLGIYNKGGKLIRALHAEGVIGKDFVAGLNGLVTHWDGKDDAGAPAAPGKYSARGYCVGKLEIEGVAYYCNDWMTDDDSPRVREITGLRFSPADELLVDARLVDGSTVTLRVSAEGKAMADPSLTAEPSRSSSPFPGEAGRYVVRQGKIVPADGKAAPGDAAELQNPQDAAAGPNGTLWVVDRLASGVEVKQFGAKGEFLRRLSVASGEPPPQKVASSKTRDLIALLDSDASVQRVRLLSLENPATKDGEGTSLSTWKTLFSKSILKSSDFASVADKLGREKPFVVEDKTRVRLLPNPLFKDAMHDLDVRVSVDAKGSSLTTSDGLPLCRFTETPHLAWVVMGHEGNTKAITIFQSDGAVVEEFRARRLANMMAFDAGEYEWTGK